MNRPSTSAIVAEEPARFTVEEFMEMAGGALGSFPGKVELVDGVIVRMSPANYPHFHYQRQLFRKLDAIFGEGIDGFIVGQELTVRLGQATVRDPDIAIFRDPGLISSIVDRDVLLLVAEVSDSTLREDMGPKKATYAEALVPEYWVVDINNRQIIVYTDPVDATYKSDRIVPFGGPLAVPGTDRTITID